MSEMDEIVKEFLVESNEGLDQLDRDLVALEKDPEEKNLLGSIFRAIHTVKGTSGVLGFPKIEAVAHVGESLLSHMRDGKLRLDPEITSGLLAMVDVLRELLNHIETSGEEGDREVRAVVVRLTALLDRGGTAELAMPTPNPVPEKKKKSRRVARSPQEAAAQADPAGMSAPVATNEVSENKGPAVSANNLRVDVGLLDKMMNLVGELVLARNQILQFTGGQQDNGFVSTAQRLNLITTELQESVMKTRMQPIGNIWNKLPRLVRDLALSCGKKVQVEMDGADTELDKTIIEAIKDPLTHIVRNAVDHGIEMPELRRERGKEEEGRLRLRAYHEGGQVNIEISDDGGGIDLNSVREKAKLRSLVSAEQASRMSERELLNLTFLPGFSTAKQVTNISGRGVGMDVVKTNIEKIGGTVDLQSVEGQGTTLKIKIPLTLAIIPALVATSGGERFAIPQVSLLELVRLEGEAMTKGIEYIHGAPVYRLRGNLLPLVSLNRELGLEPAKEHSGGSEVVQYRNQIMPLVRLPELLNVAPGEAREMLPVIVSSRHGRSVGLVVDQIEDVTEQKVALNPAAQRSYLQGSAVLQQRVTDLLDVHAVVAAAGLECGEMTHD